MDVWTEITSLLVVRTVQYQTIPNARARLYYTVFVEVAAKCFSKEQ